MVRRLMIFVLAGSSTLFGADKNAQALLDLSRDVGGLQEQIKGLQKSIEARLADLSQAGAEQVRASAEQAVKSMAALSDGVQKSLQSQQDQQTRTLDAVAALGSQVQAVSDQLVRLALLAGGITVQTGAVPYEIEFRGVTVRVEGGEASLSDGVLTLRSGTSVVTGAGGTPLPLKPGAVLDLLSRNEGPVFR